MSEVLDLTSDALQDYVVEHGVLPGVHGSMNAQVGGKGRLISDVPLDPVNFDLSAVDPFSLDGIALGQVNMTRTIPDKRLNISVVVQADRKNDHPGIVVAKRRLAEALLDTIDASMPDRRDRVYGYYIGDDPFELDGHDIDTLPYAANMADNAQTIADICKDGLTFVISDFKRLDFSSTRRADLPAAVAVKLNHPFERELPPVGTWTLGNGRKINAAKPSQRAEANQDLASYHERQMAALHAAGFAVAAVIVDPRGKRHAFDTNIVDVAISHAISTVAAQQ